MVLRRICINRGNIENNKQKQKKKRKKNKLNVINRNPNIKKNIKKN